MRINIEDKSYNINVLSKPVLVRVKESGPVVKVRDDSYLRLPRVIKAVDRPVFVNANTRPIKVAVKNTVHVLKSTQKPVIAKVIEGRARVIAVSKAGPPGPQGVPGDTQVIQNTLSASSSEAVDSVSIEEAQSLQWWISAEDATGAIRSYYLNAVINSGEPDYRKFGNIGGLVAFTSRVEIQDSNVALVVENLSTSPLIIRTIRLQKRFH